VPRAGKVGLTSSGAPVTASVRRWRRPWGDREGASWTGCRSFLLPFAPLAPSRRPRLIGPLADLLLDNRQRVRGQVTGSAGRW